MDATEQRRQHVAAKAPLRVQRLKRTVLKLRHNLDAAPEHPKAPRWRERVAELEKRIATVTEHGVDRPSDLPVGTLIGVPSRGAV